jgi:hypothetical protein
VVEDEVVINSSPPEGLHADAAPESWNPPIKCSMLGNAPLLNVNVSVPLDQEEVAIEYDF